MDASNAYFLVSIVCLDLAYKYFTYASHILPTEIFSKKTEMEKEIELVEQEYLFGEIKFISISLNCS